MVSDPPIRDAASIILLRDSTKGAQVLMGQRGASAAFMPQKFVFPGGAVDAADHDSPLAHAIPDALAARLGHDSACSPEALINAAFRELYEETGLSLGPRDPRQVDFFFRAVTPTGRPRRFDARFFLARADGLRGFAQDFTKGDGELSHLTWLDLAEAQNLDIPFITNVILAELSQAVARHGYGFRPEAVAFFDNRTDISRFYWL